MQVAGLTFGAAVLAGCPAPAAPQASAPAAGGEAAAPAADATVFEAWYGHTGIDEESILGIIDNYNAQTEKGITVKGVYIASTQGSQASEKLLTAVAGGTPPALYLADRFTVPQFAQQGFFSEITEFADAAGVKAEDYYPFAWEETVYKDGIFALVVRHRYTRPVVQQGHHDGSRSRP